MPIYSFYRIVKDIIRTIFGGKFWRKFLIIILISVAIWFILHDKGYCVSETEDINYAQYSYYEQVVNHAISALGRLYINDPSLIIFSNIKSNSLDTCYYFYYGNINGQDYLGSTPINKNFINVVMYNSTSGFTRTPTSYDFLGLTGKSIYKFSGTSVNAFRFSYNQVVTNTYVSEFYLPIDLYNYKTTNWLEFENSLRNNDTQAIISLLNEIKAQNDTILEEMTQDVQDTSQGVIDTSIVDTSGTEQATQNVQSLLGIIKGFYDNIGDEVYTISFPIKNTSFTIRSDIISSHISGTWLATFLNTFWYFIFGMYYLIFLFRIGKWLADGSLFEERRCS